MNRLGPDPDLAGLMAIHHLSVEFEACWQRGERPTIESYLDRAAVSLRAPLLRSLLSSEWELRRDLGEIPRADDYRQRFFAELAVVEAICGAQPADEASSSTESQDKTWRLSHYVILNEIARGGMGVVHRARDDRLGRVVALKLILAGHLASPAELTRFELEARAVARLDHPGIVPVFEFGEWAGHRYLVMPFISGQDLGTRLRSGPIPPRQAAEWIREIATAVQYAHEAGIIHRDLKPRNILLDGDQRPRVTDFGLAKLLVDVPSESSPNDPRRSLHEVTVTGQILGTPSYMAPEQAAARHDLIGPTTDIYALGAMFYEMLSGEPPFRGATLLETLQQIKNDPPRTLTRLRSNIPRDLVTICGKCLEKNPAERYRTAADLIDDLDRTLTGRPVRARRVGPIGHVTRWARRHRTIAALISTVIVLLAILAAGATVTAYLLKNAMAKTEQSAAAIRRAEALRRQELVRVYVAEAQSASLRRDSESQQQGTDAIRSALRAVSWNALDETLQRSLVDAAIPLVAMTAVRTTQSTSTGAYQLQTAYRFSDIDPTFSFLACQSDETPSNTIVRRVDATTPVDEYHAPANQPRSLSVPRFSDDGQWLMETCYHADGSRRTLVWSVADHRLVLDVPDGNDGSVFHPSERRILVSCEQSFFQVHDLDSKQVVSKSPHRFRGPAAEISSDGALLAVSCNDLPGEIVSTATWQPVAVLPQLGTRTCAAWLPGQQRVFFGDRHGTIYSCRAEDEWRPQPLSRDHQDGIRRMVVSPDGQFLASSDESNVLCLRRLNDDRLILKAKGAPLRFAADGRRLAVVHADAITLYSVQESVVRRDLYHSCDAAQFSRDGRWLGVSGPQGVQITDTDSYAVVADLGLDPCGAIDFHPKNASIITYGKFSHPMVWPWMRKDVDRIGPARPMYSQSPRRWNGILSPHHIGRHAVWIGDGPSALVANNRESRVDVVDTVSGEVATLGAMQSPAYVTTSPDGRWFAAADWIDWRVMVWDAATKECVFSRPVHRAVAVSPDSRWMATSNGAECALFAVPTWRCQRVIPIPLIPNASHVPLAFHPCERLLAIATGDATVHLYDYESGALIARLNDHDTSSCRWLAFDPAGARLAVTHADRVTIWDLVALRDELSALGLHPDGLAFARTPVANESRPTTTQLVVDRGDVLAAAEWYTLEERLGRHAGLLQRWPDAIDNLNRALDLVDSQDATARARLLAYRGLYGRRNLSPDLAREDWMAALRADKTQHEAAVGLSRLYLLGPAHLKNAAAAQVLSQELASHPKTSAMGKLLFAMARVRLAACDEADRETLRAAAEGAYILDRLDARSWQLPCAYLIVLDFIAQGDVEAARAALDLAAQLDRELRLLRPLDEQTEIELLEQEVLTALGQ